MKLLLLNISLFFTFHCYSQKKIEFYQKDKTQIKIMAINAFEKLEISNSANDKIQVLKNIETSMTGKEIRFAVNDYNFDGYQDFACYRLDDGMGVYAIYQIFIYNSDNRQFNELKTPVTSDAECDEFCDIQINKKKKTLQSSCRGGAEWHTDIWQFDENKNLILLKE